MTLLASAYSKIDKQDHDNRKWSHSSYFEAGVLVLVLLVLVVVLPVLVPVLPVLFTAGALAELTLAAPLLLGLKMV